MPRPIKNQTFGPGEVVWANLGSSYGWWPATVSESLNRPEVLKEEEILHDSALSFNSSPKRPRPVLASLNWNQEGGDARRSEIEPEGGKATYVFVHFFDDDSKEVYAVKEPKRVRRYSGAGKIGLIKTGLKKFEQKGGSKSLFDFRARQAQFYKDVEMAEVLTDNSIEVANILAQYQVLDNPDEIQHQGEESDGGRNFEKKTQKRRKRKRC